MPRAESAVKKEVKEMLKGLSAWQFMPVQSGRGIQGVPDHLACVPIKITEDMVGETIGAFVGIEDKQLGKVPTAIQEWTMGQIKKAGGLTFVIDGTSKEEGNFNVIKDTLKHMFGEIK